MQVFMRFRAAFPKSYTFKYSTSEKMILNLAKRNYICA